LSRDLNQQTEKEPLGGSGATRPLSRDGGVEELHGDPIVGPLPRSRPVVKNGRSSAKDGVPERLKRDNPGGGELDPAEGVRKRCKKNSPSVFEPKDTT